MKPSKGAITPMASLIEVTEEFDESENNSTNQSGNRPFDDVLKASVSRRAVLQGSLAVAGATFLTPAAAQVFGRAPKGGNNGNLVDFTPLTTEEVNAASGRTVTISSDYEYKVLFPWGTPINPDSGVPEYTGDPNTRPASTDAEQQAGLGHDGMWFFPNNLPIALAADMRLWQRAKSIGERNPALAERLRKKIGKSLTNKAGMLCINHEYGTNPHALGKDDPESLEDVRLSQAIHGVSVVAIARNLFGEWNVVPNANSRRIHVNTPVTFSGPVAGSPLLENAANNPALGTVNNCGSSPTPWGTYLTCEENFNGYFGSTNEGWEANASQARYGFSKNGFSYGWHLFDPRFDLANPDYANECNRFGWCVEIDPFDATQVPVKRTALGRVKHEAAAFLPEKFDERAVCYMGDDQRGDYCYKYVSDKPWREHLQDGESPLDHGTLYVARFDEGGDSNDGQGTGEWLKLSLDNPALAGEFSGMDDLLINTRLAADKVGATPMDRPEWTTIATDGGVFWTLTNNDRKDDGQGEISEANPIMENKDGHIIKTKDTSDTTFEWNIFILARNTRRPADAPAADPNDLAFAAYKEPADGGANVFSDPDAAWADPYGRLFIGTDGGQSDGLQDQLVVFDVEQGIYTRLLSGVASDEITGITTTPDYRTMFTNTQHPGNGSPANTNFPAPFDGVTIPRDCTLVLTRKNGGIIGS